LSGCFDAIFGSKTPSPGQQAAAGQNYPNLGTVPMHAPATSSAAERQQVTQGLVADQQNAAYTDQQLKAEPSTGGTPPAPPTPVPAAVSVPATESSGAATGTATAPAVEAAPGSAVQTTSLPPPPAPEPVAPSTPATATATAPAAETSAAATPSAPATTAPAETTAPVTTAPVTTVPEAATSAVAPAAPAPEAAAANSPATGQPAPGTSALTGGEVADAQHPIAVIFFGDGSAGLNDRDRAVLRDVALLHQQQGGHLLIVGHASERTGALDTAQREAANDQLSLARAKAVTDTLYGMGVPSNDIAMSAVGSSNPIFYEYTPTGEAGNRRVEIYLTR
jgi:outer membrane protein OmpA-like peptidoglycan-associated protein